MPTEVLLWGQDGWDRGAKVEVIQAGQECGHPVQG